MKPIKNLFLVDDDDIFVFLTKKTLEQTDLVYHIETFNNGKAALDFLQRFAHKTELLPEIIFLDLSMPVMDGWTFLEEYVLLKDKIGKQITIYILSSSISPHDIERARAISSVSDYIIKPISKERFVHIVKSLVD